MKPFKHIDATTINGAIKLKSKGKAKLIAGGTDLLGILKDKILPEYPETVINIKTIPNLDYIKEDATGLKVGALTKLGDILFLLSRMLRFLILAANRNDEGGFHCTE
jgi:xanthine dehydrogenase YagS FAD-binding subunit